MAFCQTNAQRTSTPSMAATQTKAQCSVNALKSNVQIGSLTCNAIDLNFAKEFKAIADGTKQDTRLLNLVLEQLRTLSGQLLARGTVQLNNAPGGFAVSGGALINPSVTNVGPPPAKVIWTQEQINSHLKGSI